MPLQMVTVMSHVDDTSPSETWRWGTWNESRKNLGGTGSNVGWFTCVWWRASPMNNIAIMVKRSKITTASQSKRSSHGSIILWRSLISRSCSSMSWGRGENWILDSTGGVEKDIIRFWELRLRLVKSRDEWKTMMKVIWLDLMECVAMKYILRC